MMYYYRAELRDITLYAKLHLRNSFISLINHANLYLSVVEMHGGWSWRTTHRCESFQGRGSFCTATLLKERLMVGFCIYSLSVGESVSDSGSEKQ